MSGCGNASKCLCPPPTKFVCWNPNPNVIFLEKGPLEGNYVIRVDFHKWD